MLVVVHRLTHSLVVGVPLISVDAAITVLVVEVSQEFEEHFILGKLATDHTRVQLGRHDSFGAGSLNRVGVVPDKLVESSIDEYLALVHFELF